MGGIFGGDSKDWRNSCWNTYACFVSVLVIGKWMVVEVGMVSSCVVLLVYPLTIKVQQNSIVRRGTVIRVHSQITVSDQFNIADDM